MRVRKKKKTMGSGDGGLRELFRRRTPSRLAGGGGFAIAVTACLLTLVADAAALPKKKAPLPRTVSGKVLDANDNGISGADVELTDLRTGKKFDIFTESDGQYKFSDLVPTHDYEVRATYKGVASQTRKASSLLEPQLILNLQIPPPAN